MTIAQQPADQRDANLDPETVAGFGREWACFDQAALSSGEREEIFSEYFSLFPWKVLPAHAVGADIGCGSGRWASIVGPRVGRLLAIDPSPEALSVAQKNLAAIPQVQCLPGSANELPVADASLDFAYSLGVLHHVPDTGAALVAIARKLRSGAPFLLYLYYAFDGAPLWFRMLWRLSDGLRRLLARLPFAAKRCACDLLAAFVYWPLARAARLASVVLGRTPRYWPLAYYSRRSFYVMRTDSLDRFGTRLEQRFTRVEISAMLEAAGFEKISFSPNKPYWTAVAYRK